jgi:hypothetical protein
MVTGTKLFEEVADYAQPAGAGGQDAAQERLGEARRPRR